MEKLFTTVLSLSFTGSLVILAVLAARLALKKTPKILSYALWAVVLVRLVCPISFSSPYYGVPQKVPMSLTNLTEYESSMHAVSPDAVPIQPQAATATISPMFVLSLVWAAGVAAMLIYGIFTYVRLRRKLVGAVRLKDNIYLADYLETPFVLGFVRPKIYLPSGMDEWEKPYILAHEQHHIRRLDYLAKPVGFVTLCLHWFNPLVWLAFVLFCKDMEMSCDEAVIKKLGNNARADYAAALLNLATGRKIIAGMPLAFGEGDTKNRIQNMKSWKKPVIWIVAVAAIGCAVLAAFLLTDKKEDNPQAALVSSIHYENQNILFTIPKGAENPEEWTIQIYGRAEYPDGMTMSRHYLEGTVWEAGKEYSIDVSNAETLTDLSMYLYNQEAEKEIDLMEYLPHSESAGEDTISAAQIGNEILAKEVLTAIYSCTETETAGFVAAVESSAENPNALIEYATNKLGEKITADGAEKAVNNRVIGKTALLWPDTAVEVTDITLEPIHDQTDTQKSFAYKVSAKSAGNENGQVFEGEIVLQLNGDAWQVSGIQ